MSPRKKPPNWEEIKTRYVVNGEKPSDIAKDYNVAPKTISNRASEEKWGEEQGNLGKEIREEIKSELKDELKSLCEVTLRVHKQFMENLEGQIGQIQNPYLFDGERTNSLFQTAMNNSVKLMMAAMKAQEEEGEGDGLNTANPVYRRIYNNGQSDPAPVRNYASKPVLPMVSGDSGEAEREDNDSD